jgi:hypothetical protein
MASMTVRERMLAVYRRQLPDQIPISIYNRYLPRGETERLVRNMGLGISDYYPPVTLLAPPWHTHSGYISEVKGTDLQIRLSWEKGGQVETRIYETPVGTVSQRTTKDPTYGSDWISKYYIEGPEDYKVMQYIVENTVFCKNEQGFKARMEDLGADGVLLGRLDRSPYQKLLMELAGPERFLLDLHTEPDPVIELMEVMTARMDEAFAMALEIPVEVIWQPDNISVDMTPPDAFQKYCLPFYETRGHRLHEAGIPYVVHMDGRLKALQGLIAQAVFDVVESFSLPMLGNDLTLSEAWAAWPDKVTFPNFPSPVCLEDNNHIQTFLNELLATVGSDRPFMLQVSEDIPTTEWQRVLPLLCRSINEHGKRQ